MRKSGRVRWRRYFSVANVNPGKVLVAWVLVSLAATAYARQSVSPGAVVDVLQRMQGSWKTECTAIENAGRQQHLTVTFTHITVSRREFSGTECRVERQRSQRRYRFTLTEPVITTGGDRAYALNLSEDVVAGSGVEPFQLNLIRVEAGKLVLGDPEFSPARVRPDRLDHRTVFTR